MSDSLKASILDLLRTDEDVQKAVAEIAIREVGVRRSELSALVTKAIEDLNRRCKL